MRPKSSIAAAQRVSSEFRTLTARYKVAAVALGDDWLGKKASVAVFLYSTGPKMVDAVALRARFGLTPREIEIAVLLQSGLSNREIAKAVGITVNTVRRHVDHVLAKLNVHSRSAVGLKIFD
jgi:DNA-binding NarL/FixJ family response regulator